MSSGQGEEKYKIGPRLREERERLGLSQEGLGAKLATTGRTIKKYEANETSIRATELLELAGMGADVFYIVTGTRSPIGTGDTQNASTASRRLAELIDRLNLTEADADLLAEMASRLAK